MSQSCFEANIIWKLLIMVVFTGSCKQVSCKWFAWRICAGMLAQHCLCVCIKNCARRSAICTLIVIGCSSCNSSFSEPLLSRSNNCGVMQAKFVLSLLVGDQHTLYRCSQPFCRISLEVAWFPWATNNSTRPPISRLSLFWRTLHERVCGCRLLDSISILFSVVSTPGALVALVK